MSTATPLKPIEVILPPELQAVVDGFGRTEDLAFAPDGRRLAVAGFGLDRVFLLEVVLRDRLEGRPTLAVEGITELVVPALRNPHGLSFVDDETLVVANRGGDLVALALPPPTRGVRVVARATTTIASESNGLASPGSVAVAPLAPDLHEVLVCNNAADTVTRHLVDWRTSRRVVGGHVAVAQGLDIPDGVAISHDRRWLAISSHNTHAVVLYRDVVELGPESRPDGILRGLSYPHGLRFTADDRFLVVADAGEPNLHVFASAGGDWSGEHSPARTLRVMDDAAFQLGRNNPAEGGPKGLDIDQRGRLLAITSEHQPLAVFELADVVGGVTAVGAPPDAMAATAEAARTAVLRELRRVDELYDRVAGLQRRLAEQDGALGRQVRAAAAHATELAKVRGELLRARAAIAHLHAVAEDRDRQLRAIRASTSWRATSVGRAITARLRRVVAPIPRQAPVAPVALVQASVPPPTACADATAA